MKTYLVTGCAGFIGSNFVHYMLEKYQDIRLVNLDKLTYAGNLENLEDIKDDARHIFVKGDICDKADLLCQLVSVYRGKAEVHRAAAINMPLLIGEYPNLSAVIAFPAYAPSDVVEIALNGSKIPMGVTRHLIPGRALGLNIPIEKFDDSSSLEEKNAWLDESIRQRLKMNKIRLYQEPVFVFDE